MESMEHDINSKSVRKGCTNDIKTSLKIEKTQRGVPGNEKGGNVNRVKSVIHPALPWGPFFNLFLFLEVNGPILGRRENVKRLYNRPRASRRVFHIYQKATGGQDRNKYKKKEWNEAMKKGRLQVVKSVQSRHQTVSAPNAWNGAQRWSQRSWKLT